MPIGVVLIFEPMEDTKFEFEFVPIEDTRFKVLFELIDPTLVPTLDFFY